MMRVSIWMAIMVPAGSLIAENAPSTIEVIAALAATVLAGGLAVVINDILDREKDEITAPELPLPSGIVTPRQALVFAGFLAVCIISLWALASTSLAGFIFALAVSGVGGLLVMLYSFAKPLGIIAPIAGGCAYATIPVAAWFAAGGGSGPYSITVVIIYAMLIGTGGIIHAAIRDVDSDAEVGNLTVAVRLGPSRALGFGTFFYLCSTGCILWAAAASARFMEGLMLTAATTIVMLFAHRSAVKRLDDASSLGRPAHVRAMRPATLSRLGCHIALIAVVSPLVAVAIGVVSAVLLPLQIIGYRARVYGGGLRRALKAVGADHLRAPDDPPNAVKSHDAPQLQTGGVP
jgi:4-hydroxybenzoate polyprenyltransferase